MPTSTTNYGFQKPLVNDPTDEDLWGGYLNDSLDDIDTEIKTARNAVVPVGAILPYGGTSAPSLWVLAYGQAISRTTYAALFTAYGTTYGVGDGSTTFNVPDLRGRVIAGQDDMGGTSANRLTNQTGGLDGDTLGATGGAETHTLTEAQMPVHDHNLTDGNGTNITKFGSGGGKSFASTGDGSTDLDTDSAGSGTAHNNVQPTIILNYIIYAGV